MCVCVCNGVSNVMVIIVGKGLDDLSSNSRPDCLHFT